MCLVQDGQDASGLSYRRNRYYDANTGRFTQEDPAGIAGGLNVYGFGDGDPVSYSDPYGLCPAWWDGKPCTLQDAANFAAGFGDAASFGATSFIRRHTPGGDGVNYHSGMYAGGQVTGTVAITVVTEGAGAESEVGSGAAEAAEGSGSAEVSLGPRLPTAATRATVKGRATDGAGVLRCEYCGQPLEEAAGSPNSLEFDHADPYARGGGREPDNIVASCRTCNRTKAARTPEEVGMKRP